MLNHRGLLPLLIKEKRSEEETAILRQLYAEEDRQDLKEKLRERKMLPFGAAAFCSLGMDVDFWTEILESYRKRTERIISLLDRVYAALWDHGVRRIFVSENLGALLSADGDKGLFSSGDVDNCADISEREKIYAAFRTLGFSCKERFAGQRQITAAFYPNDPELGKDFYLSIDFLPLSRLKLPCFVEVEAFLDWEDLHCYKNTAIRLPPADALMYICLLHISLHSFSRAPDIRLYFDVLNMAKLHPDYHKIEAWARRDRTCLRCGASAFLSASLVGAEVSLVSDQKNLPRLLRKVYNKEDNDLKYNPKGLRVLSIELACDDMGIMHGVKEMLLPNRTWMKQTYRGCGLTAHLKHWIRLL